MPPIRCFLSYSHSDDQVMGFVKPFMESLRHFVYADRGRELEIFYDREAIGWGELAQATIEEAVVRASVFIPIITRQYFDRPYCRLELFTFHNQAQVLGRPSLLLPVVLLGREHLTDDSPDEAVRIIAGLQYRSVEEAWIEGSASSVWRRQMLALSRELADRADEQVLSLSRPVADEARQLEQHLVDADRLTNELGEIFDRIATLLIDFDEAALLPYSEQVRDVGRRYERSIINVDRLLRGLMHSDDLRPVLQEAGDLAVRLDGKFMEQVLRSLDKAEVAKPALCTSLRGFREGLIAVRSGQFVIQAWHCFADGV